VDLQSQGRIDEAAKLFRQVLASDPNEPTSLYSLGVILLNSGRPDEALLLADRGVAASPVFAPMWFLRGTALQGLGRRDEALQNYDQAIAVKPDFIEVYINSGALLRDMFRHHEALTRFVQALEFEPENATALANAGILFSEFKEIPSAINAFQKLLSVKPDYDYGLGLLLFERLQVCDWTDFEALQQMIISGVREGRRVCKSLAMMTISDSAEDQYRCARIFASHFVPPPVDNPYWKSERYRHDRIRVAYLSPDLREHPVGHLMAGIFEHHDRSRFETFGISLGIDDGSRLRARMEKAFDHFIDAKDMLPEQIARFMREIEIDIAIDLAGYTSDSRIAIFSHRPAPSQVNYLGYAGTLGTENIDYIIADPHVLPAQHWPFYTEKVVYLPNCYFPTDGSIAIAEASPGREACGLPVEGLVFCSFSHPHKINPPMFDVWMRLLKKAPGSVLWLATGSPLAQANLRSQAETRGVEGDRLIFAGRVPAIEDHLARYRLADIFLDTYPYNAHTTAVDALMAGLPVVTCRGNAFPARVAASLLENVGLPDMIANSLQEYEEKVSKMIGNPEAFMELKERLTKNRTESSLFNTKGICRDLEAAYIAIWRAQMLADTPDVLSLAR
jgi:protein O-GlcNAc transferase